jgi:hypothetical protein
MPLTTISSMDIVNHPAVTSRMFLQAMLTPKVGREAHRSEEKIAFGIVLNEIDEQLNRCLTGPDQERDRVIFWLYFRQGIIASLPTIRLGTKGVRSVIERLKHAIREQILGSRSDSDDGQELESKANSLANSY